MTYTALSLVGVLVALTLDVVVLRTRLVGRRAFWVAYLIVLAGQLATNGVLTGERIVRYDGSVIIGGASPVAFGQGRIAWAPVEDLLFGFSLVLQTLAWWVFWGRSGARPPRSDGRSAGDREAAA
jgi:lycopene cyclase domain-containing protein